MANKLQNLNCTNGGLTYLFGFILAEYGLEEMFSSIGLLTEGMGTFEMPLS
jgi:hypothetical protein